MSARIVASVLGASVFWASACASSTAVRPDQPAPWESPWRGPAVDAASLAAREPWIPALRVLHGRTPLIHLVRGPWSPDRPFDPAYSMALFDDGTLVYEGRRCVRLGGVVIARLGGKELAAVRALLDTACAGFDRATDGEVCADAPTLRLTCASEDAVLSGTDHCRGEDDQGVRLQALAAAFIDKTGASAWIGEPVERQACGRGDRDLAPRELAAAHDGWFTRAQVARSAIAHQP